jgi:hypothetical protein
VRKAFVVAIKRGLHPEHIQAALYQAFDIQALYKDDRNQLSARYPSRS